MKTRKTITDMGIPTKWAYIAERCRKRGKNEAAEVADKIDKILVELYGKGRHTKNWYDHYRDGVVESMSIQILAGDAEFCIACELHVHYCHRCRFAKENNGPCCKSMGEYLEIEWCGLMYDFHKNLGGEEVD